MKVTSAYYCVVFY